MNFNNLVIKGKEKQTNKIYNGKQAKDFVS